MKIIRNETLIKRNHRIGQWMSLAALAVLGVGMYISFQRPEWFGYSLAALVIGFTMTQVGMYFSSRWGRSPRPDEQLDAALKGLPGDTTLYHYVAPAPHVLVGPGGLWVLQPYHQRGRVRYTRHRWRLSGGGFLQAYLSIFGQEGLGRPDLDMANQIQALRKHLARYMDETQIPDVRGALIFTHAQVEIDAREAPFPAMKARQLKDFMRQKARERVLSSDMIEKINSAFSRQG